MPGQSPPACRRRLVRLGPSAGAVPAVYLVTLATAGRECLFGTVSDGGGVTLSEFGWIVQREWLRTGFMRPELALDAYVVMPNHLHAVLAVAPGAPVAAAPAAARVAEPGAQLSAPQRVLGAVLAGFKAMCTVQINHRRGRPGAAVWQRGFVEQVLRTRAELDAARRHVEGNPLRWAGRAATGCRGRPPVPGTARDSGPAPQEP